jgi:hypothetical protein
VRKKLKDTLMPIMVSFKGIKQFKECGSKAVRQNGYVLINPITGHKNVLVGLATMERRATEIYF